MQDTVDRIKPFWENEVCRSIMSEKRVIIVTHKNTLRAFFKYFQPQMTETELKQYKVPNAMPIVYEFDSEMNHVHNYILMDQEAHRYKSENPDKSYNNIDWKQIKVRGEEDLEAEAAVRMPPQKEEKTFKLRKPTIRQK